MPAWLNRPQSPPTKPEALDFWGARGQSGTHNIHLSDFFGNSAMTNDEFWEIRRREFRAIREKVDLNQTDFGALLGRKRGMIKNYEKGYPIPEKLWRPRVACRQIRRREPPMLCHGGAAVLEVMQTGQEVGGMGLGTTASPLHRRRRLFPRGSGLVWPR
jgi:hypothetical protein